MSEVIDLKGRRHEWGAVAPALEAWSDAEPPVPLAKRIVDAVFSAVGLVLLAPVLLLVAAAVRLDTPGPALFRQTRVGRGGRPFGMYKFRTMVTGNDAEQHRRYVTEMIRGGGEALRNGNGHYKLEGDERITRVGRVLRATSLDELPQLINVARGEMSLVGPRPPLPYEVAEYDAHHLRRLRAVPGMTGLWQVSGRNETTFEQMVELDVNYIENWSLGLDLMILARTVRVVLSIGGS